MAALAVALPLLSLALTERPAAVADTAAVGPAPPAIPAAPVVPTADAASLPPAPPAIPAAPVVPAADAAPLPPAPPASPAASAPPDRPATAPGPPPLALLAPASPPPEARASDGPHLPAPDTSADGSRQALSALALPEKENPPPADASPPPPARGEDRALQAQAGTIASQRLPGQPGAMPGKRVPPLIGADDHRPVSDEKNGNGKNDGEGDGHAAPPAGLHPGQHPGGGALPADAPDTPALRRFARPFTPDGKPLLSLILLAGADPGGEALQEAGELALAFAVDPTAPDAAVHARRIRAAGQEVLVLAVFPEGAQASDVAAAIGDSLALVPEAVAVVEAGDRARAPGGQGAAQLAASLVAGGQGLVTGDMGFDAPRRAAIRAGVPTGQASRAIGEGEAAIRRRLDQAAFRAAQTGSAIVLAEATGETLRAVRAWLGTARAATVTLAPVSAVLAGASTQ